MKLSEKRNRLDWVDCAKGIAIILVVYRHILIGVSRSGLEVQSWLINANEIVYSFRMPLFFILSGLFISKSIEKRNNARVFIRYKFDTIYYPYLVWGVIQISIQIFFSRYTNATRDLSDFLLLLVHPRAIDQLWYLYALFNTSILFYFLYSALKMPNRWLVIVSLGFYGISYYVKEYSLFHDTFYFLIFLTLGHVSKTVLLDQNSFIYRKTLLLFTILLPAFVGSQVYWLFNQELNLFLFALIAILGSFFVFIISILLQESRVSSVLKEVGKHSLQIYLMHLLIVSAVRILLVNLLHMREPIVILLIGWFLGVTIPILFYKVIGKKHFQYLFTFPKRKA